MRRAEGFWSLAAYLLVVAALFPEVVFGNRTVASAPHIPFTLPTGPVGQRRPPQPVYVDPYGPGWIHEANWRYRDDAFRAGRPPFWHPYEACGNPYLANLLPGVLFPPNLLLHVAPPPLGFDLAYLARLVLAGWFQFLFLRRLGLGRPAAFVGGVLYLGSGYLLLGMNLANAAVEAVLPGFLFGLATVAKRPGPGGLLLLALTTFLLLCGGNPQPTFLGLALGAAYLLTCHPRPRVWARAGLGVALGALLAAPQWLPFLSFLGRAAHAHTPGFAVRTQPWFGLAHWVVPGFFADAVPPSARESVRHYYHLGAAPLILLPAAWVAARRTAPGRFAILAFLLLGAWFFDAPGLRHLGALPLLNRFHLAKYLGGPFVLCGAWTAAWGLHHFLSSPPRKAAQRLALGLLLAGLIPLCFTLAWHLGAFQLRLLPDRVLPPAPPHLGPFPFLLAGYLAAAWLYRRGCAGPACLLLFLLPAAGVRLHRPETYPLRRSLDRPPPALDLLPARHPDFRIYSPDAFLHPNTATLFRLHDIRYAEALKSRRYAHFIGRAFAYPGAEDYFPASSGQPRPPTPVRSLSLLAVRYVFALERLHPLDPPFRGPARRDFTADLSLSNLLLRGKAHGALRLWEILGQGEVRARRTLHPKEEGTLKAELPAGALPYLGVRGGVHVLAVTLDGRPLSPATLLPLAHRPVQRGLLVDNALPLPPGRQLAVTLRAESLVTAVLTAVPARRLSLRLEAGRLEADLGPPSRKKRWLSLEALPGAAVWDLELFPRELYRLGTRGGVTVYENRRALPRAFGVYRAELVPDDEAALTRLLDPAFRPRQTVLLAAPPPGPIPPPPPGTPLPRVRLLDEAPHGSELTLEADFPAPGYLVLLDNHDPGWSAVLDGSVPLPLLRANVCFRAVPVPAGRHRVLFTYEAPGWRAGLLLAALAAAALLGLSLLGGQRP